MSLNYILACMAFFAFVIPMGYGIWKATYYLEHGYKDPKKKN